MADPPPESDTGGNAGAEPDGGPPIDTPRWVKAFGLIAVVVILVVVVVMLVGGDRHGPGRHAGGYGDTPPAGIVETRGHTPPPDVGHSGRQP